MTTEITGSSGPGWARRAPHGDARGRPSSASGLPPGRRSCGAAVGCRRLRGEPHGGPTMPDVLKLHADGTPDAPRRDRRRQPRRAALGHDVRRAERAGEPARPRPARRRRRAGRPARVVRPELARGRSPSIHAARKAGLVAVPLSYRFNAEEMRTSSTTPTRRSWSSTPSTRRSSTRSGTGSRRCAPYVGYVATASADAARRLRRPGTTCSPASPTTSPIAPRRVERRRGR